MKLTAQTFTVIALALSTGCDEGGPTPRPSDGGASVGLDGAPTMSDAGGLSPADGAVMPDGGADAGPPPPPPPNRVVFVYTPHGVRREDWASSAPGEATRLGSVLQPLEELRDYVSLVDGLDGVAYARSLHHDCAGCVLATSAEPYVGGQRFGIPGGSGTTFDVQLGSLLGVVPFPHVPLAVATVDSQGRARSFRDRDPVASLRDPAEAFARLFGGLQSPNPAGACGELARPPAPVDASQYANYPLVTRAFSELITAAFACDATRVVTLDLRYQFGAPFTWLGLSGGYHENTHDDYRADAREEHRVAWRWFASEIVALARRLQAVPAGSGNLLDHTLIVWMTDVGLAGPMTHTNSDLPVVLIGNLGGRLAMGQHVGADGAFAKLSVTIATAMGVDVAQLGPDYASITPVDGLLR